MYTERDYFFFNDTPPTEIYALSLHAALPISGHEPLHVLQRAARLLHVALRDRQPQLLDAQAAQLVAEAAVVGGDRKSTRLNSSHANISYAVFCLKKKTNYSSVFFCLSLPHTV